MSKQLRQLVLSKEFYSSFLSFVDKYTNIDAYAWCPGQDSGYGLFRSDFLGASSCESLRYTEPATTASKLSSRRAESADKP
jgi:hypothetical protein